jgi:hypothetical protein
MPDGANPEEKLVENLVRPLDSAARAASTCTKTRPAVYP